MIADEATHIGEGSCGNRDTSLLLGTSHTSTPLASVAANCLPSGLKATIVDPEQLKASTAFPVAVSISSSSAS